MNSQHIQDKLKNMADMIPNSILRISAKGVPHIVVDSYYSIAYFTSSKTFNIYEGYATKANKKIRSHIQYDDVFNFFKSGGK